MKLPSKCPTCRGRVVLEDVEELVRGGNNTAIIKVKAVVCLKCGDRFYSPATVQRFEKIRGNLAKNVHN